MLQFLGVKKLFFRELFKARMLCELYKYIKLPLTKNVRNLLF